MKKLVVLVLASSLWGCQQIGAQSNVANAEEAPKVQTRKGMEVVGAEAQLTEAGKMGDSRVGSKLRD
jgi:negative regulator of sigma E activity